VAISKAMTTAAKKLRALKDEKEATEAKLKALNKDIVVLETVTLPKLMDDNEMESFKIAGVGTIYTTTETYTNVKKEDRAKLYDWLRDNGHGDMIGDWVFPNTLQAFARRQLEDQANYGLNDGNKLPDFIKTTLVPTANLRRAK
jgi:hypothetical protein